MLVVTRASGESVIVGGMKVMAVEIRSSGRMRLGVSAPYHIPVDREEIWQQKRDSGVIDPGDVAVMLGAVIREMASQCIAGGMSRPAAKVAVEELIKKVSKGSIAASWSTPIIDSALQY